MLNRMWSDRRERNLRQVKTNNPVPEGGEQQGDIRPLRGRYYWLQPTASSASLHMRLSIVGPLRGPITTNDNTPKLRMNPNRTLKDGKLGCGLPSFGSQKAINWIEPANKLTVSALQATANSTRHLMSEPVLYVAVAVLLLLHPYVFSEAV